MKYRWWKTQPLEPCPSNSMWTECRRPSPPDNRLLPRRRQLRRRRRRGNPTGKSLASRHSTISRTTTFEMTHRSPANLVQAARNRAAEAVKGVVERWKQGEKASKPHFTSRFASYDARTVTVNDDHCTLATIEGRVTAEFVLPDEQRDTPHSAYLFNDDYDLKGPHSITTKLRTVSTSTCGQSPPWRTMTPNKAMPSTFPSLVSTSASQTSQPPQPDASGAAPNSTTGIEEYEKRRSDLNKLGLDGHTRTFSESVASRLGGSNKCFTRSRTSWLRKLSKTTVRISCSSNSTASANAYLTRRRFTSGRSTDSTSTSRTKAESEGLCGETD